MKKLLTILVLISSLTAYAWTGVTSDPPVTINTQVQRVIDGDTIKITTGEKVRLLNIDSPETNYRGRTQGRMGTKATIRLSNLLPVSTRIRIELSKEGRDSYNRLLGTIYRGILNINAQLIREGLAIPYIIYPNIDQAELISTLAREARSERKGMYGAGTTAPYLWRRQLSKRDLEYFTGDIRRKCYVTPDNFKKVKITDRIFFRTEGNARSIYTNRCR